MELVVCGVPFGSPNEKLALRQVKELGFTSVQIYTFWRDFEPRARGSFEWEALDRMVRLIQEAGLKYVPFLQMGPKYGSPDWWLADPNHFPLRCLEHGKDSKIESIWNPKFRPEISRVLEAFAEHYGPWDVLESIQPGICGDYGESIFPVLGNWPGDYHTHRGYWCGDKYAVSSFQRYLIKKHGSLGELNAAWRSHYGAFEEVQPFLKNRAPSRTAFHDLVAWYQESMTEFSEFWMSELRRVLPKTPAYMCTGGADDEPWLGALFSAQARAAARHGGGIRLTNEINKFDDNFRLTAHVHAACGYYGAYLGLEPVGPLTEMGVRARVYGSATYGNRQMFSYYGNFFNQKGEPLPGAAVFKNEAPLLRETRVERGIAFFWPIDDALIEGAMPAEIRQALVHLRRRYPVSPINEEMILDGALAEYGCLIMLGARSTRAAVLERIARWTTQEGGKLLAVGLCRDLELEPVRAFDAVFGIQPHSEEAWGHTDLPIRPAEGLPRLSKIPKFHVERGWLDLAEGTELISQAIPRDEQGGTRVHAISPIFRRRHEGGGEAIFYCGPVNLDIDPERCFADPGVLLALLDDMCEASGIEPLGTLPGELARGRVGDQLLILHPDRIEVRAASA